MAKIATKGVAAPKKVKVVSINITAKEWFDKMAGNSYFAARGVVAS